MKLVMVKNKYVFVNDDKFGNREYLKYISKKIEKYCYGGKSKRTIINKKLMENLEISRITGKYVGDTIDGKCNKCGIEYSITENSLVWACPICDSINVSNKIKIKNFDFDFKGNDVKI